MLRNMKFLPGTTDDLLRLIAEHPLAWLVSNSSRGFEATPLPMLAETNADGELVALIGHCSRFNAQVEDLQIDGRALLLFCGPHGYISPSMVSQKHWAPTWNFAVAVLSVEVEFEPDSTLTALDKLVEHLETDKAVPWTLADVGHRLEPLMSRIIGFRAHVRNIDARFKLGQEESTQSVSEIISNLRDPSLKSWMEHFNSDRLNAAMPSEKEPIV
jgi:transcriptional regulator